MGSSLFDVAALDGSPAALIVAELIAKLGLEKAHARIDEILDGFSTVELAAHAYDWAGMWARPKQIPPGDDWESDGHLQGRGSGKTLGCSEFVNAEVEAGRAPLVCLIAQDEDSSIKLHVTGPSGLIATARPWFRPVWRPSDLELIWPNGSRAYVRTPEVPGKIRGLEYHLAWASELQSWPAATMEEAWMNVVISTRLGRARIVWDATAKRRHALLTRLLEEAKADPARNRVVRGSTYENALNLGRGYIEKLERKYPPGTRAYEEELFAKLFEDADGAVAQAAWIKKARRRAPARYARRALAVDAAVTSRAGSDLSGIVVAGLGHDGQGYVIADLSGRHKPEEWAAIVLDAYFEHGCDCVVVETNKGGDLVTRNLRAAADARKIDVVVLGKDETPRHVRGVVYVREVYARGEKSDRAKPLSTAYEAGRISHVEGARLAELEEVLTTWTPTPGVRSPDRLDATVHVMVELLGLDTNDPAPKRAFEGIERVAATILEPAKAKRRTANIATILGGPRWRGRI